VRVKYNGKEAKVNWYRKSRLGLTSGDEHFTVRDDQVEFIDDIEETESKRDLSEESYSSVERFVQERRELRTKQ